MLEGIIFTVLLAINLKDFLFSCVNYLNLSFDQQIPITWDFTSLSNLLPYKDIYFPYGTLFYLKNINAFFNVIYLLLPPILFTGLFLALRSLLKNKIVSILALTSFFLFVRKFTGMENFIRYGIILGFSILSSYVFYKNFKKKAFFFLGVLIGIIFSLAQDQGIYSFLIFLSLIIFTRREIFSRLTIAIFGIALGFLPFFIFLQINGISDHFVLFLKNLPDFTLYAKTPFIPFSTTTDNLFTFGAIFLTTTVLSFKMFFTKKSLSFIFFLEIGILLVLILLEQKNIIRSIDKQITFIAFFLYIVLFCDFVKNKFSNLILGLFFILPSTLAILGFGLHPFINYKLEFKPNLITSFAGSSGFLLNKNKSCLDNNLNKLLSDDRNTKFLRVKEIIDKDSRKKATIFDYLSDPVFYVLFNQKPPYYFTIFESTPLYAQRANIKYIKENKVNYVIYNKNILSIQDRVPTSIRNKILYNYILDNFELLEMEDNFLIYVKKNI